MAFPCLRSRLRIWSRETGSAVPSRVSLLISILRLNLALTYGIPSEFRGGVHLFIPTNILRASALCDQEKNGGGRGISPPGEEAYFKNIHI